MSHEIRRIGVTGATGNIGQEVLRQGQNIENVIFVPIIRNRGVIAEIKASGEDVRWIDFEKSTPRDYHAAVSGLDGVIHLAASVSEQNDFELHDKNNTQATRKIAEAAAREGAVIIYAGSTAQYTRNTERVIDDSTIPNSTGAYGLSKIRAHVAARGLETSESRKKGYRAIQVVPGMTIGPDASWTHTWVKVMENPVSRFLSGVLLDTEVAWSDKEDLAQLFIQIALNPYVAETDRYLAINGMASVYSLFKTYSELANVKPPHYRIPKRGVEPILKTVLSLAGKKAPVSPEVVDFAFHGEDHKFRADAARRDYDWHPRTIKQTLDKIKGDYKPRT